jgi:hypothetical protein
MRTLVDIPEEQIDDLKAVCSSENISRAEAVRRAVSLYLAQNKMKEIDAFGLWSDSHKPIDGLEFQETIREEWS